MLCFCRIRKKRAQDQNSHFENLISILYRFELSKGERFPFHEWSDGEVVYYSGVKKAYYPTIGRPSKFDQVIRSP